MTITSAAPEINRDRYGRPLVLPPNGGKPVAYTRCTTYIDCLEDKFNLQKWMQRMVATGLASRPELSLSVLANLDNKSALDRICDQARDAASASAAATTGSSVHALTDVVDRGQDLPAGLSPQILAMLNAYTAATADLNALHIERFLVQDPLQVGGTADRIVEHDGVIKIADTKTGSIEWGALKIAMQLAVYARSSLYDHETGARTPHGADLTEGIIIHLPAVTDPAEATCQLYRVDLEAGWAAVQVAKQVRAQRKHKFRDLVEPLEAPRPAAEVLPEWGGIKFQGQSLEDRIKGCTTPDDVRALWAAHQDDWSDELTRTATAHIASLQVAS